LQARLPTHLNACGKTNPYATPLKCPREQLFVLVCAGMLPNGPESGFHKGN
jgi:hypothetical protein